MKVEIWYKYMTASGPVLVQKDGEITTVRPDTQSKSGYHLVLPGNDLPKPSVPEVPAPYPVFPRTPQELCNLLTCLSKARFGTIVDQLRASGCATRQQCQSLYSRLSLLAQESDRLLRKLETNLENKRNQLVAEQASQK